MKKSCISTLPLPLHLQFVFSKVLHILPTLYIYIYIHTNIPPGRWWFTFWMVFESRRLCTLFLAAQMVVLKTCTWCKKRDAYTWSDQSVLSTWCLILEASGWPAPGCAQADWGSTGRRKTLRRNPNHCMAHFYCLVLLPRLSLAGHYLLACEMPSKWCCAQCCLLVSYDSIYNSNIVDLLILTLLFNLPLFGLL